MKLCKDEVAIGSGLLSLVSNSKSGSLIGELTMRDDMIQEILLRVPPKSLVRCKSLSKEWREFISRNPSFRKQFIDINKGCFFMLGFYVTKHISLVSLLDDKVHFLPTRNQGKTVFKKWKRDSSLQLDETPKKKKMKREETVMQMVKSPGYFDDSAVRVLGSSNGFLLCSLDPKCPLNYTIINPINKLCFSLPAATASSKRYSHGFICFSSSPLLDTVDYYKVVRGVSPNNWDNNSPITLEIISSDSNHWSLFSVRVLSRFDLDCTNPQKIIVSEKGLVYVPGTIYKERNSKSDEGVLIFDESKNGSVKLVEFPPLEDNWVCRHRFGQSEGLILYARFELGQLKIWMFNDQGDGWSLVHNVILESWLQIYPELFKSPRDLSFCVDAFHPMNRNVIFIVCDDQRKLVYNLGKSTLVSFTDLDTCDYLFPHTCGLIGPHLFLCE